MTKEILIKKLNRELNKNIEAWETLYRGKVFVVTKFDRIVTFFKTKRGAEGYIKREKNFSWYDEYKQDMTYAGDGMEYIEVKESELADYRTNKLLWYLSIKEAFHHINECSFEYDFVGNQANKYLEDGELKSYVLNTLKDLRIGYGLEVYECKETIEDQIEELEERLSYYKENKYYSSIELAKEEIEILKEKLAEIAPESEKLIEEVEPEEIKVNSEEVETEEVKFDDVKITEVKKDIFVKALIPHISKNDSKETNDQEIKNGSTLALFKIEEIIELTKEQYNYFIENLLSNYEFLKDKGGYMLDDNSMELLYGLGVAIVCEGKETLLVDPSGHTYARYLNKIVEDIDEKLAKEINNINLDNKAYKDAIEKIDDNQLYKVEFPKEKVIDDNRIILNMAMNGVQVATGLSIKEFIKENKAIDIINLDKYTGDLEWFKNRLTAIDNGTIINLFPNGADKKVGRVSMRDRLERELLRASNE